MHGKAEHLKDLNARWSVIGRLQIKKVKYVARLADELQSAGPAAFFIGIDQRSGASHNVLTMKMH